MNSASDTTAPPKRKLVERVNTWFAFGVCIAAGFGLLYFSVTYYLESANLQKNGQETTAHIQASRQVRENDAKLHLDNSFVITFTTADGKQEKVQMNLPLEVYRKITEQAQQQSNTVHIRYLPSNPQMVDLIGADHERRLFIIFCGATGLLLLLYGFYGFRVRRDHRDCVAKHHTHVADW